MYAPVTHRTDTHILFEESRHDLPRFHLALAVYAFAGLLI
jgi:hypothetical protein